MLKCLVQLFAPEQGTVIKSYLRRDYSRVSEPSSTFCTVQWKRGCSGLKVCSAADPQNYWVPSSQQATEAYLPLRAASIHVCVVFFFLNV